MKLGFVFCAWLALGCASRAREPMTPVASDPMTRAEIAIGELAKAFAAGNVADKYSDAELTRYVNAVGRRVARHSERPSLPWTFSVLDSPDVDARAYPGGRVVITRGALAVLGSEAELAGVFAHEVAHVSSHHSDSVWRPDFPAVAGDDAVLRSNLRDADQERQADALALGYLASAKYDPGGLIVALRALGRGAPGAHSEDDPHPTLDARASRLAVLSGNASGEWGRERYLAQIDGLALGPGMRAPRFVAGRYVVPGALALRVPSELRTQMTGNLLQANGADGSSLTILALPRPGTHSRAFEDAFRSVPHTVTEVAGRPAYAIHSSASVMLLDREDTLLVLVASDEMLSRVLETAAPAAREQAGLRMTIRRVRRATDLARWLDAECPDTTDVEAERLNGISPSQRLGLGSVIKCVSPNSIAKGPRRK